MEPSTVHSTFTIERSYPHSPERVFAAFADPEKKRRWFAPDEEVAIQKYELDFRVGGREHLEFKMGPGAPIVGIITNSGTIADLVPNQRFVAAYTMALDGRTFSVSLITIEVLASAAGTDLICTHQGTFLEGSDGPEGRKHGWTVLLDHLGKELAAGL